MPVMSAVGMRSLIISAMRMLDVTENRPPSLYMRSLQILVSAWRVTLEGEKGGGGRTACRP